MIFLFTDFGAADIYLGQVKAQLARFAPGLPVIDLLHDVPAFRIEAAAHLLAALARHHPPGVTMAVVDPGVGTSRRPVAVRIGESWLVGPDNGLLSVLAARSEGVELYDIRWRPQRLSASFHGRDLFAPITARLAARCDVESALTPAAALDVELDAGDLSEVVYVDHYGNVMTGLRAECADASHRIHVGGTEIRYARIFGEAPANEPFWYVNSIGLIEIAIDCGKAARRLRASIGDPVRQAR